jgi:hypothetical protein
MKNILKYIFVPVLGVLASCSYDFPIDEIQEPTSGNADFTKMVVIGDGIAAGFMDGALYDRGQLIRLMVFLVWDREILFSAD